MNMFKPVKVKTVSEYIASVPDDRKDAIEFLHAFIQKAAPTLKAHMAYNMQGYGSFPYKSYKGEMLEWPVIALANQKNYISVYVCAVDNGEYIAEKNKARLGKVSVGKSCIRFSKLEHVHLDVLKEVIQQAAKSPGLVSAAEKKKKKA
jgi:uncharacterized protein YdhG (YjbR/CyaY superfamily)